jgi:nucleotide-binding universal stress UspA family protein
MHRFRHLAVALSRTAGDAELVRYAAMVARLGTAAEVRFVHVLPPEETAQDHEATLAAIRTMVGIGFTGVPAATKVQFDVVQGPVLDRLLSHAAENEVDLLLVGHRREHPMRYALARRLAMKAPCSVWLVPEGAPPVVSRILAPVDYSDDSADQLAVAASLARLVGAEEVLALHVTFDESRVDYEGRDAVLREEAEKAFRDFVAPVDTRGVTVTPVFEDSANVPHAIHRQAEAHAADLIVLATRGRSRSAAVLLGSVTEEAMVQTRRPLLVVKHFGARMGVLQALLDRRFRQGGRQQFD